MSLDSEDEVYDSDENCIYEDHRQIMDLDAGEALDCVDEAFKHFKNTGELYFYNVCFGISTISHLMKRLEGLENSKSVTKSVTRIEMEACSFIDDDATRLWIQFLQHLGHDLKEIFIVGIPSEHLNGDRQISILRGLQLVVPLERLAVDRADLRGQNMGIILQNFLTNSPKLQELRFAGCRIDNQMYIPFVQGLKGHSGLKRLDLDGWLLNDIELNILIDALVLSPSRDTMESLDISNSRIGPKSFVCLARLLKEMTKIEELTLCCCYDLFDTDASAPFVSGFGEFVKELSSSKTLKEIWLNKCDIGQDMANPLLDALQKSSTLEVLHVEGMVVQQYKKYTSAWGWSSGNMVETAIPLSIY